MLSPDLSLSDLVSNSVIDGGCQDGSLGKNTGSAKPNDLSSISRTL